MAQFNSTALIVDDRNSSIAYSSGWLQVSSDAEYDQTKSGADKTGMTATFVFTGTGVEVYGSQGSYDVYGVPVSSYEIDGLPDTRVQYTAPIIDPGSFTSRTLFYQSPSLSAGEHTLVITNLNGTQPSVYWLDYIVYSPSAVASSSSSSASSSSATSTSTSILQSSSSSAAGAGETAVAQSSADSGKSHAGAIVGGVVGGVVFLVAILLALWWFCYRKPRRASLATVDDVATPFGSWPAHRVAGLFSGKSEKLASSPSTPRPLDAEAAYFPGGPASTLPRTSEDPSRMGGDDPASSVLRLHQDSGVRLPPGQVVDVPPAYEAN